MATFGTRRLQRKSISCQRARRTIKAIETYLGRTISSDTSNHTPSEKTPGDRTMVAYNGTRLDKAYGR